MGAQECGHPAEMIEGRAAESDYGPIVMGTHGAPGFSARADRERGGACRASRALSVLSVPLAVRPRQEAGDNALHCAQYVFFAMSRPQMS